MLNEEQMERAVELIIDLIEELNTEVLETIGKNIKTIGELRPTEAHKLIQQLYYSQDYDKIVNKLSEVSNLGTKDIEKIFEATAKKNQAFSKQFYEARNIPFIPYEENKILQRQVQAFANTTANLYKQFVSSGFYVIDNQNIPITKVYNHMLEKAVYSLSTGQTTYQEEMSRITKEMAKKGIRTRLKEDINTGTAVVDYSSGYSRRLDSTVRMHILDNMRNMSNQLQEDFGKEFNADGVEVSHHKAPARDHSHNDLENGSYDIDGHQFFKPLNEEEKTKEYKQVDGVKYRNFDLVNERLTRQVSTLNCYHYIFFIVLGVSKPQYTQEQLDKDKKENEDGFDFDGKHYTLYEGSQLQRRIETKVREYKDRQIVAKASSDMEEVEHCQTKIRELNKKYNELSKVSGLPTKRQRMIVSGYKRISTKR